MTKQNESVDQKRSSILVTGASKGLGQAIAQTLAGDGFDIAIHYGRDEKGAQETLKRVEDCGVRGRILSFDITNRTACAKILEKDIENYGVYYGVVLCAGVTRDTAFPSMTGDDWDVVIKTNLDGFYNVLAPLVMPMIQRRQAGRIVALSSVSGLAGNRGQVNYSASKAGIIGAVKALAIELAKRKITVNCVAPGLIETQMTQDIPIDIIKNMIPMQKMGTPQDVAHTVAFLCSEKASYITRQVFSVNGGMY